MTYEENEKKPKGIFSSIEEIEQALENKSISLHSKIVSIFKTVNDNKPILGLTTQVMIVRGIFCP